jgi:hypothetical protein
MPARLPRRLSKLSEIDWPFNPDSAVTVMTYAERGVSLEQRTHRTVMFQSHFCYSVPHSQRLRTPLIAPLLATLLGVTGLLRSLRTACASLFAAPSTAESEFSMP